MDIRQEERPSQPASCSHPESSRASSKHHMTCHLNSSSKKIFNMSLILIIVTLPLLTMKCDAETRLKRRSHKHLAICRREFLRPLEKRESDVDLVFKGTVQKIYKTPNHHWYRGVVRIKRVIKGDKSYQGSRVIVEGFGSKKICVSDANEKDTRIFLVNTLPNGRLKIHSSLIRANLENLRKAVTAAKSEYLSLLSSHSFLLLEMMTWMRTCVRSTC